MKIKLILALLISNIVLANEVIMMNDVVPQAAYNPNDGNGSPANPGGFVFPDDGLGAQATPIDDYAPILVILGITLAGTVLYKKQKQLN